MNELENISPNKLLADLAILVQRGVVTKEQVLQFFATQGTQRQEAKEKIDLKRVLYYIGGFVVLLGIVFLVAQYWDVLDLFSRSLITLGSAISAYALGYYFFHTAKKGDFGQAFFIMSIALFPVGLSTTLDAIGISPSTSGGVSINAALLFLIYFSTYVAVKADLFLPFSIIAASTFFFSFTNFLFKESGAIPYFYEYRVLILGISYLLLGYYFWHTGIKFVVNLLYFFGLGMVLGSTLSLQGFSPNINVFWQLAYPFLLTTIFYGSIKLQNKVFLLMATIFTIGEISKITAEYFSKSIGWPISLIIAGLVIMGIGYMSFELNRTLLKQGNTNA